MAKFSEENGINKEEIGLMAEALPGTSIEEDCGIFGMERENG